MPVSKWAVVLNETIENIVEWDGTAAWSPPPGAEAIPLPAGASIGWRRQGEQWTAPPPEGASDEVE